MPRLHLVTVCTQPQGWFAALVASAARGGYELTVLGAGQPWTGFGMKLRLVRAHLDGLPDDDRVCFVDAYDVLLLEPAEELVRRYLTLAPDGQVVLAPDDPTQQFGRFRWHVWSMWFGTCRSMVLNSGAYMGQVDRLRRFLDIVGVTEDVRDDQRAFNAVCAKLDDLLVVDRDGRLFFHGACTSLHQYVVGRCRCGLVGPGLVNPRTGLRPVVLQMPGGVDLNEVCRQLRLPLGHRTDRFWFRLRSSGDWPIVLVVTAALILLLLVVVTCGRRAA